MNKLVLLVAGAAMLLLAIGALLMLNGRYKNNPLETLDAKKGERLRALFRELLPAADARSGEARKEKTGDFKTPFPAEQDAPGMMVGISETFPVIYIT